LNNQALYSYQCSEQITSIEIIKRKEMNDQRNEADSYSCTRKNDQNKNIQD